MRLFQVLCAGLLVVLLWSPAATATEPGIEPAEQPEEIQKPPKPFENGSSLRWRFRLAPDHVGTVSIRTQNGQPVLELRMKDGSDAPRMGWRPDKDPRKGRVSGRLDTLWLTPGIYTITQTSPEKIDVRTIRVSSTASQHQVLVRTKTNVAGVNAWHTDPKSGAHDGYSWAKVNELGEALLETSGHNWTVSADGLGDDVSQDLCRDSGPCPAQQWVSLQPRTPPSSPLRRELVDSDSARTDALRFLLLPMTCLFASIAGIAAWRRRHSPGLRTAVWLSVGLGALSISPTLLHLSTRLLDTGPPVNDPPDSVAQLAAMIESLPRLSDQSSRFGFPEGVTWMTTGPAWLGYLVPVVIGTVTNPIVAQNIGIALGTAALFMSAWLLARSAGLAPGLSIFAGTVTVLGPAVWDELDAMSLDRSTLFLVPLFFACLNMALRKPVGPSRSHRPRPQKGRRRTQRNPFTRLRGWRWSVAAGISLGAVVYGQVYFGIYLAVAMLLIGTARVLLPAQKPAQQVQPNAPPMLGTHRYRFRQLVIIAGVGILVMSPCLAVLHHSMDDTVYGGADSATTEADESAAQAILKPITEKELAEAKGDADASGFRDFQLDSTRARLLSAVTQSIPLRRAAIPTHIMPYGGAYFVLLTVGLLMARRRTAMWVATIDLLLLMILSLGPVLRWNETGIGPVAPYGIFFATIPGFDQLKNVHRFALLAASIAGLPLALGLDGIIGRFNRTLVRRTFWTIATAGLVISVGLPRPKPGEPGVTGTEAPPAWQWPTPQFRPVSASTALQSVDPGPAFVLPLAHPTSPDVMLPLLRDGFSLVNEPPFEHTRRTIAPWWETNPTLNRLSWTAGSQRPTGLLAWTAGDAAQRDLQQLARNGVKWIILLEEWLEGPELVAPTKRFLDALVPRVAEDERVTIWSVTPNTGQP